MKCVVTVSVLVVIFSIYVDADTLVWSDEFKGPAGKLPDSSKWKRDIGGDGWGNQELEYYTNSKSNAALDGHGNLVITARKDNPKNYHCWYGSCQYTSARLLTKGKFSQMYGSIEARIKVPTGKGIWPAFWMVGDDIDQVGWPKCGEIDIMEHIGSEPLAIHGTLHGPGYSGGAGLTSKYTLPNNQPFSNKFHVYRVDWTENSVTFSVDGHKYGTKKTTDTHGQKWVYDHSFFIVLNVAVGGGWPGPPDSSTKFPQSMIIDYVRVYSKNGPRRQGKIKGIGGRCIGVAGGRTANRTPIKIYDCKRTSSQKWTISGDGTIRAFGKCLDVAGAKKSDGTPIQLYNCINSDAQKWALTVNGDIVNIKANKCLDARQPANQNAVRLQIWDCAGTPNQKWTLT